MRRVSLAFLVLVFRSEGFCQASPEVSPTSTTPKIEEMVVFASPPSALAPTTAATSVRPRETSADTAAKINATLPKFSPVKTPESEAAVELPDLREIDKPRNGIIRLPKYMVPGRRAPAFKEYDLLTPEGKLELAYQRNPGLRFGSLPFLTNNGAALFMAWEELRLERMAEMNDLVGLYQYSDPKSGAALKREAQKTFIRTGDFGWSGSAIRGEDHGINAAAIYNSK